MTNISLLRSTMEERALRKQHQLPAQHHLNTARHESRDGKN